MKANITFLQGHVWALEDLEDRSIALDGAVQGPALDHTRQRYSFDHHKNCIRHVTLATCEQVRDAILLGADFEGYNIYINDQANKTSRQVNLSDPESRPASV